MKKGFWGSLVVFLVTLAFLIGVNAFDFGLNFIYPEGIPETVPYAIQMREFVDTLQEYNKIDGIISILSFISTGVTGLIAKARGISLTN